MTKKPILVMMSYRGGARLMRCLESIKAAECHFSRIILSVTANIDSEDFSTCITFRNEALPRAEVICTGNELPTMRHQEFWIDYLLSTGASPSDYVFWLAYDDELDHEALDRLLADGCDWPLKSEAVYIGPWNIRHEQADVLWAEGSDRTTEVWTALPQDTAECMPALLWIAEQLRQPTYIQMSGVVAPLRAHANLVKRRPKKQLPMRIEMATAVSSNAIFVNQFKFPLTYIYGRPNSDRANYSGLARREDYDLALRLILYVLRHPLVGLRSFPAYAALLFNRLRVRERPREEWRVLN